MQPNEIINVKIDNKNVKLIKTLINVKIDNKNVKLIKTQPIEGETEYCDYTIRQKELRKNRQKEWRKNRQKEWRKNNSEKVDKWRKNNREKVLDLKKRWRKNNREKIDKYMQLYHIKRKETLHDSYIKRILCQKGFPTSIITQELIEVKRIQLKIKRFITPIKRRNQKEAREQKEEKRLRRKEQGEYKIKGLSKKEYHKEYYKKHIERYLQFSREQHKKRKGEQI